MRVGVSKPLIEIVSEVLSQYPTNTTLPLSIPRNDQLDKCALFDIGMRLYRPEIRIVSQF